MAKVIPIRKPAQPDRPFRPMLAAKANLERLKFPVAGSPKLDGIRGVVRSFSLLSRTLKPIPNDHVRALLSRRELEGLDGELIVGPPTADDVYRKSESALMSKDGTPPVTFFVFDSTLNPEKPYAERHYDLSCLVDRHGYLAAPVKIVLLEQQVLGSYAELVACEERQLAKGYEGLILRSMAMPYKYGRSTAREQGMLKLKRMESSEAVIRAVVELEHNQNPATVNTLGLTERRTCREHKVGAGVMGALVVEDLNTGCEFSLGTGFTAEERKTFWDHQRLLVGKIISYSHFPIGAKDKPRFPAYRGFRDPVDFD